MSPTYRFTGPHGQSVAVVAGVVVVRVDDGVLRHRLEELSRIPVEVAHPGGMAGGAGMTDPLSVYLAGRDVLEGWTFSGHAPDFPGHLFGDHPGVVQ